VNEKLYLRLEIGSRTDVGRVRENNEDACRTLSPLNLFIISDGMGGQSHGETASAIAADTITAQCSRASASDEASPPNDDVQSRDYSEKTNRLASAVRLANRNIYQTALNNLQFRGMGATVVAAWLEGSRLSLVHVGDSRAYLFRGGVLQCLTGDHTLVAEQVRRGLIAPEQAHLSKMQNVLIRALGIQEQVVLDAAEYSLLEQDVVLLCSDGLTRMVTDTELTEALLEVTNAQAAADYLVSLANSHGGEDNVSVIVVRVTKLT
jgi:serine/threonine protein phosphatase PrpC